MVITVAAVRREEAPVHIFRITLGLNDRAPTEWNGKVAVEGGEVVHLSGWRFEGGKDAVFGPGEWKCTTHNYIAPGERVPVTPANGKSRPAPQRPWPNGVTIAVRGEKPVVVLTLPPGEVRFQAAEVVLGEPQTFLDGRVRVERLPETSTVRPPAPMPVKGAVQDDYPAFWVRYKTGKHYLAWVAYQQEKDRVLLAERDGPGGQWSEPIEVAGPGDHFRVALAGTHNDTLWIVWSSQRDHNWDLYARPYQGGKLGEEVRLTDAPGPDIWHGMTTDRRGRAWLVWQGFRDGQADVFARCADADGWHEPVRVSSSPANDWDPVVAADPTQDRVWVGWDTYETENYQVRIRSLSGGPKPQVGEELVPEPSALFGAHVSLACDKAGRLWAAWDSAGPNWGKDSGFLYKGGTGLYASRTIRVKCLVDGRWLEPAAPFLEALPADMQEYNELPQLQDDSEGRMWLAFRHRTCRTPREDGWAAQGRWDSYATAFLGDRWLAPIELSESGGRLDMRTSSQRDRGGNVYFAYAGDHRPWVPPGMPPRNLSVAVSRLGGVTVAAPREMQLVERAPLVPVLPAVHPHEKEDVARIRGYQVAHGGKTYRIYRGDLHRHTDLSGDGIGDGSILDLHRYSLDAAALDYILVTDHNMGQDNEYCWWQTQKANDLYTVPGNSKRGFISMYGYERSVPYPNGHRNVIWTERGHRTLPLPLRANRAQMAADTAKLYAYLRRTNGICTLHTSATDQGTNWEEHDDALEPVVEIFQGYHTSYEAPGAPETINDQTARIHGPYKGDGFVSLALAKGYRLGFQASSDHIATHDSYACILAEEFSRQGLVDALRKRHTYAATDNIVLDVRMGPAAIMGDEVRTDRPQLDVTVLGTGPVERVDIVRNGEVVHAERPRQETAEVRFHWEDAAPHRGAKVLYYYVRVVQKNGHLAWASPIWVKGEE
jgi:hypothetical protein